MFRNNSIKFVGNSFDCGFPCDSLTIDTWLQEPSLLAHGFIESCAFNTEFAKISGVAFIARHRNNFVISNGCIDATTYATVRASCFY